MDGSRFDHLTKKLAEGRTRRSMLKIMGAAIGSRLLLEPVGSEAAVCRPDGTICSKNGDCCSDICGAKDRTGRRRCGCPAGSQPIGGQCCSTALVCGSICLSSPCASGTVCCAGVSACVDLQSDPQNCGACDTPVDVDRGEFCCGGAPCPGNALCQPASTTTTTTITAINTCVAAPTATNTNTATATNTNTATPTLTALGITLVA